MPGPAGFEPCVCVARSFFVVRAASICLARALAGLLPTAAELEALKGSDPGAWQEKCGVVRECVGVLAESLNTHLRYAAPHTTQHHQTIQRNPA